MLNPRARENTPFYRARYFRQRLGSTVCLRARDVFRSTSLKKVAPGTSKCLQFENNEAHRLIGARLIAR